MLDFLIEQAGAMNLTAVYATGDDPSHQVWQQTGPINNNHSVYVAQRYNALLGKRGPGGGPVQIVPGLGNHAGFPVNCFAIPPSVNRSDLYTIHADTYRQYGWLSEDAHAQYLEGGFFSMPVQGTKGVAIVLNDNLHVDDNFYTALGQDPDMAGMLTWLEKQLQAARASGQWVHLLFHHPPGNGGTQTGWLEDGVVRLSIEYDDVVKATFHGHIHSSDLSVWWKNATAAAGTEGAGGSQVPFLVNYIGPAPVPRGGINPSFRTYDVDADTGEVLEMREFRVNLASQGLLNRESRLPLPRLEPPVVASRDYNLSDLSAASWASFANRMRTDNASFFAWELNAQTGNPDLVSHSAKERLERVCHMIGGTNAVRQQCQAAGL